MKYKIFLNEPSIAKNEVKYLKECVKKKQISVGSFLSKFEKKICSITKSKYSTVVCSGSSALHIALIANNIKKNEIVIAPSFTFVSTINAINNINAKPWFLDISLKDLNLDLDLLEKTLKKDTYIKKGFTFHKKTKSKVSAIIVVYSFGLMLDMTRLLSIVKKYNLKLIADAACAIGSSYHGKNIGEFRNITSIVSFNGNKIVTTGAGGALLSNNKKIIDLAKYYSSNARAKSSYEYNDFGFNYRMANINAAVGLAQLEKIDKFMKKKKFIYDFYKKNLKIKKNFRFFPSNLNCKSTHWFSGVIFDNNKVLQEYIKIFLRKKIEAKVFWKPLHLQKIYKKSLKTNMKNTNYVWDKIFTLPSGTSLSFSTVKRISRYFNNIKK